MPEDGGVFSLKLKYVIWAVTKLFPLSLRVAGMNEKQ